MKETPTKAIYLPEQDVWVIVDTEAKIKKGDLWYDVLSGHVFPCDSSFQGEAIDCYKLIYQSKPIFDNIPVIEMEWVEDLDKLLEEVVGDTDGILSNDEGVKEGMGIGLKLGFKEGYNKRKETHPFSMDDLIDLVAYIANFEDKDDGNIATSGRIQSEIVKTFIAQRQPKSYNVWIEERKIVKWEAI